MFSGWWGGNVGWSERQNVIKLVWTFISKALYFILPKYYLKSIKIACSFEIKHKMSEHELIQFVSTIASSVY